MYSYTTHGRLSKTVLRLRENYAKSDHFILNICRISYGFFFFLLFFSQKRRMFEVVHRDNHIIISWYWNTWLQNFQDNSIYINVRFRAFSFRNVLVVVFVVFERICRLWNDNYVSWRLKFPEKIKAARQEIENHCTSIQLWRFKNKLRCLMTMNTWTLTIEGIRGKMSPSIYV